MYQFSKAKMDSGGWKFDLGDIHLYLDGFYIEDGKHFIKTPEKAIAFFTLNSNVYSVSNQLNSYKTAEELYNAMVEQYAFFNSGKVFKNAS